MRAWVAVEHQSDRMKDIFERLASEVVLVLTELQYENMSKGVDELSWWCSYRDERPPNMCGSNGLGRIVITQEQDVIASNRMMSQ